MQIKYPYIWDLSVPPPPDPNSTRKYWTMVPLSEILKLINFRVGDRLVKYL